MHLRLEGLDHGSITDTVTTARRIGRKLRIPVAFTYRGVELRVNPGDSVEQIVNRHSLEQSWALELARMVNHAPEPQRGPDPTKG